MEVVPHIASPDAILAPSAVVMLLGYHAFLFFKVKRSPCQTAMGVNQKARRLWVKEMLRENSNNSVLAVQTIRNSIMESTLMATTNVILIAGLATYFMLGSMLKQPPLVGGVGNTGASGIVKSLAILICFLIAFLCHIQSIRFLNHVNYMFNIPLNIALDHTTEHVLTEDYIANLLEHGTIFKSLGSRIFYVAFPLLLWLFGSIAMFLCSLILLHFLCYVDFVQVDASGEDHMNGGEKGQ